MTKDVLITVCGLQIMDEEGADPVEVITAGEYYYKNGKHYVLYDEVMEGFDGITKTRVKIGENGVDIVRRGVSDVHMSFEEKKKNLSTYHTPFGNLMIGIEARKLHLDEREDAIDITVDYNLEMNYEHLAECSLTMKIRPRTAKEFSLG